MKKVQSNMGFSNWKPAAHHDGLLSFDAYQRENTASKDCKDTTYYDLGLDYLDVKKEIRNELKQVDKKVLEKLAKQRKKSDINLQLLPKNRDINYNDESGLQVQKSNKTMVFMHDSSIQDLRHAGKLYSNIQDFDNSSTDDINRRNMLDKLRSKSSSPVIAKPNIPKSIAEGKHISNMKSGNSTTLLRNQLLMQSHLGRSQDTFDQMINQSSLENLHQLYNLKSTDEITKA
jgi:hypothetical protein